jgi:hypothetical protein
MAFDADAVKSLFSEVVSHAQTLGIFPGGVNGHAPENPPSGPAYAVWLSSVTPVAAASGLAATSGRVEFTGHVYTKMRSRPLDQVDPGILLLACDLLAAYSGDLTLGGTVRDVDLLGAHGTPLQAQIAFADFQGTPLRVAEITLPIVINDLWVQS